MQDRCLDEFYKILSDAWKLPEDEEWDEFLAIEDGEVDDYDDEGGDFVFGEGGEDVEEEEVAIDDGIVEPEEPEEAGTMAEAVVEAPVLEVEEGREAAAIQEEDFTGTKAPLKEEFAGAEAPMVKSVPQEPALERSLAFFCTPKKLNFDDYSGSSPLSNEQQRQLAMMQIRCETSKTYMHTESSA